MRDIPASNAAPLHPRRHDDQDWRLARAQLIGTTARHTRRHDADPGSEAIEELRDICVDPEVLADAASYFAASDDVHRGRAVALLVQAGADAERVGHYVELRQRRASRNPLLRIVDQANRSDQPRQSP